jgi:hypothetical protein
VLHRVGIGAVVQIVVAALLRGLMVALTVRLNSGLRRLAGGEPGPGSERAQGRSVKAYQSRLDAWR